MYALWCTSCGPHFLVWASLKSRIIPVCLHSRLQRHTVQVCTMKGLKTTTTSLSQRGQNTQPNKQALLPWAVGRDLINTSKPSQIWSTISIWDLRDHSAIRACVSPQLGFALRVIPPHSTEQNNFSFPEPHGVSCNCLPVFYHSQGSPRSVGSHYLQRDLFWVSPQVTDS